MRYAIATSDGMYLSKYFLFYQVAMAGQCLSFCQVSLGDFTRGLQFVSSQNKHSKRMYYTGKDSLSLIIQNYLLIP